MAGEFEIPPPPDDGGDGGGGGGGGSSSGGSSGGSSSGGSSSGGSSSGSSAPAEPQDPYDAWYSKIGSIDAKRVSVFDSIYQELWGEPAPLAVLQAAVAQGLNRWEFEELQKKNPAWWKTEAAEDAGHQFDLFLEQLGLTPKRNRKGGKGDGKGEGPGLLERGRRASAITATPKEAAGWRKAIGQARRASPNRLSEREQALIQNAFQAIKDTTSAKQAQEWREAVRDLLDGKERDKDTQGGPGPDTGGSRERRRRRPDQPNYVGPPETM